MSKRIEEMLAKTQGIRAAKDIPDSEVVRSSAPKTAVGTMAAWQASQAKIEELEQQLAAAGTDIIIPVDGIVPNPWQPRRVFDEDEIEKLAGSIAEVGLIQPVIVRNAPMLDTPYQLVAGERRWRAHQLLGQANIKAIVIQATDEEMIALALAENFDRADLTAYEVALAIRGMADKATKKDLARALGISRSDLYRYLSFFELPGFIINDLEIDPGLLGRDASEDIVSVIRKHGQPAIDVVSRIWTRVKSGEIDQGKIAGLIEASVTRGEHVRAERDIRKLFVGKEQAGSITRDTSGLTIKIRSAALTPDKENELRQFVEGMFKNGS